LQQVGPGRYEATFEPTAEGAYFIGVGTEGVTSDELRVTNEEGAAEGSMQTTAGWVLGYSPEYASLDGDPALLAALAETTGGRALDIGNVAAVFEHNLDAAPASQPIWPWLTLAAVLLLPLDVAARRLTLTRRDWARAWEKIRNYELGIRNEGETVEAERAEGMAQLLRAKERAQPVAQAVELAEEQRRAGEQGSGGAEERLDAEERSPTINRRPPTADERPTTSDQPPTTTDQPPADDTLAARLRKRRGM
jgi:hypothetical protein